LCTLVKNYSERFGLEVKTSFKKGQCLLREELQLLLYRIISELLHNVVKHAQAEHAEITYQNDGATVTVAVIDDGVGFSYSPDQSLENNSFGLFSIQEKINRVGGKLEIEKNSHGGSQVKVSLPLS
jgi:signal transduction histidine kinase